MLMTKRKPATIGEILTEEFMKPIGLTPVSYTHLTLPTNREV